MIADDDLFVTIDDIYSVPNFGTTVGFCGRGTREWFARHNLDWLTFVRQGAPASVLLATGDALARRVVEHARSRHG